MTAEEMRIEEARSRRAHWRRWGPYLSERQWGTVREDYSEWGTAWEYFPHDHSRSRAYRWGEDGILGISDNHQRLCFALALWNEKDEILKERFFGLTNSEGNHGEDVKECYFYLDNTPTHSYMRGLYKYPHLAFPYELLLEENRRRGRGGREFEILDTGIFDQGRYFDVFVEYAKAGTDDILIRITAFNRADQPAPLHLLPTLWFRNTWSWNGNDTRPRMRWEEKAPGRGAIVAPFPKLGAMSLAVDAEAVLFTENETNIERLFGGPNGTPYVKDSIHRYIIRGDRTCLNPANEGTKAAAHYRRTLQAGESWVVKLRLARGGSETGLGAEFDEVFELRRREAEEFFQRVSPSKLGADARNVQRQAFAGMLWSKQYYHYVVRDWLDGDSAMPSPPPSRKRGRNREWEHLYNEDILSMPDKWEYPWFASWDLAFHCIPLALIDPDFAKQQLVLLTREWYMHPNGQIPAYEWAFGDVNPPVHAWAAWRVYKIEKKMYGRTDKLFLERVFQKLLLNFTWWVNRKDEEGNNIFEGGFLGLDNIGVFDRSKALPTGGHIEQSDGTSWMAMYCLNLLAIALELAQENPSYEDIASKFFEHFLYIANAMNHLGGEEAALWNDEDGFFYDTLHLPGGRGAHLKVRSMVGLIPLFAIETLELSLLLRVPGFTRRLNWFMEHRPDLSMNITCEGDRGICERRLLSIVSPEQLRKILARMLDEAEFLGAYGIRALSRYHLDHPYILETDGVQHRVDYEPGESTHSLFGGNSNWRGPVWMPVNFLMIESLQKFHYYLGDSFRVECPTGSGRMLTLWEVSLELSRRLGRIFLRDSEGRRPVNGPKDRFKDDPHWKDLVLFYEYFHGDNGSGIGASHQTGWTGLIAKLLQQGGEYAPEEIYLGS